MLFPADVRGGYCYASLLNGRCANQNSQLLTKMQCCCDSGRCWSDGSTPEMCPIRGSGGFTHYQVAFSFLFSWVSMSQHRANLSLFFNGLTLEEYQRLCIQIPDSSGGVPIPGGGPGGPGIPNIYPIPYPRPPIPGPIPEVIPGPIQVPGHTPSPLPRIPDPRQPSKPLLLFCPHKMCQK